MVLDRGVAEVGGELKVEDLGSNLGEAFDRDTIVAKDLNQDVKEVPRHRENIFSLEASTKGR